MENTFNLIPPITIHQETPQGVRLLGKDETLIKIRRDFGSIPGYVDPRCAYLDFMASNGKRMNISYFRNRFMRDIAFFECTNPENSSKTIVKLPLKLYFHKFSKSGSRQVEENLYAELQEVLRKPSIRKAFHRYQYITEDVYKTVPELLKSNEGCCALYFLIRDVLNVPPINRKYTLDILLVNLKKHSHGRSKIA
jgi:hypothetical protein